MKQFKLRARSNDCCPISGGESISEIGHLPSLMHQPWPSKWRVLRLAGHFFFSFCQFEIFFEPVSKLLTCYIVAWFTRDSANLLLCRFSHRRWGKKLKCPIFDITKAVWCIAPRERLIKWQFGHCRWCRQQGLLLLTKHIECPSLNCPSTNFILCECSYEYSNLKR